VGGLSRVVVGYAAGPSHFFEPLSGPLPFMPCHGPRVSLDTTHTPELVSSGPMMVVSSQIGWASCHPVCVGLNAQIYIGP
jgi:hypothetical protein